MTALAHLSAVAADDEHGATYTALNNAMRAALLTAVRPESWDPSFSAAR